MSQDSFLSIPDMQGGGVASDGASKNPLVSKLSIKISMFIATVCLMATAIIALAPASFAYAVEASTVEIDGVTYAYTIDEAANCVDVIGMTSATVQDVKVPATLTTPGATEPETPDPVEPSPTDPDEGDNATEGEDGGDAGETGTESGIEPTADQVLPIRSIKMGTDIGSIKTVDVSACAALESFQASGLGLEGLKIAGCAKLTDLECANNKLSELDLANAPALESLNCANNELTELNISKNPNLRYLACNNNRIEDTSAIDAWLAQDGHTGSVADQTTTTKDPEQGGNAGDGNTGDDNIGDGNTGDDVNTGDGDGTGAGDDNTGDGSGSGNDDPIADPDPVNPPTGTWVHSAKGWWYDYGNDKWAVGWLKLDSGTYFFDEKGWMQTGWELVDGAWYYFKNSGAMKTGWQKVKGKWYYLNPADGKMLTGKHVIKDKTYFLTDSGAMKTGWNKEEGIWYYYDKSGAMQTDWISLKNVWYYLNTESGAMQTGWLEDTDAKYYFAESGAMVTGWKEIDKKWYYFDESGVMQVSKWIEDRYVGSNGAMVTDAWVDKNQHYVGPDGKKDPNKQRVAA